MTGAQMLQALKPLKEFAAACQALETIAREATRLQQGTAAAEARLGELDRQAAARRQECATLQADMARRQDETARQVAERLAAAEQQVTALEAAARERVAAAQAEEAAWRQRAGAAKAAHDTLVARLTADETALRGQIAGLRQAAKRMLDTAGTLAT